MSSALYTQIRLPKILICYRRSKIGANSFIKVCEAETFDFVITDWDCVEEQLSALEEKGIDVVVVEEPK